MNAHTRGAAVFGGLLVVMLGAAWVQYTAEPAVEMEGKVLLLPGEADDITRITWTAEGKDKAVIERKSDALGDYLWVDYTRYEEVKPEPEPEEDDAQESQEGEEAETPEPETEEPEEPEVEEPAADPVYEVKEEKVFKAGERGDELLASLSPMLALRTIEADADRLEAIGFSEVTERLEIERGGKTQALEFGGEVYGSRNRYARNPATGEVFLVEDDTIRSLKFARTRLPDRTLWPYERSEVARATITGPAGSLVVKQENADDADKATWVPADDGAAVDLAQVETWMDKAFKLKAGSYEGGEEQPNAPEQRFTLSLEDAKGGTLELTIEEDADGTWWGRSDHTRSRVTLLKTQVEPLFADVAALTGG